MEPKREGWGPVFFLLRVFASDSRQRAVRVRAAQESRNGKAGPPVPVSSELIRSFLNRELIHFKYVACVDLRRRHSRGRLCHRAGPAPIPPNEWSGDCQHRQHQAEECREYSRRQVEDVAGVEFAIPEAGVLYWGGHLSRALYLEYFARVGVDANATAASWGVVFGKL